MIPVAFLAPNQALAIAVFSYNGEVKIGLIGDYDSMPDLDELGELRRGLDRRAARRGPLGRGPRAGRGIDARGLVWAPWTSWSSGTTCTRRGSTSPATRRSWTTGRRCSRSQSFGLTTNNITYAVMGDAMNYWDFFPAPEEAGATCRCGASPRSPTASGDDLERGLARLRLPAPVAATSSSEPDRRGRAGLRRRVARTAPPLPSAYQGYRRTTARPTGLRRRPRGRADAVLAALLHLVADRRLPRRLGLLRRRDDRALERVEQDRADRRLPAGPARGRSRSSA